MHIKIQHILCTWHTAKYMQFITFDMALVVAHDFTVTNSCIPRHTGTRPDHLPVSKHVRVSDPAPRMKPLLQLWVATVSTSKGAIVSGSYVIAPFGMGASAGHSGSVKLAINVQKTSR